MKRKGAYGNQEDEEEEEEEEEESSDFDDGESENADTTIGDKASKSSTKNTNRSKRKLSNPITSKTDETNEKQGKNSKSKNEAKSPKTKADNEARKKKLESNRIASRESRKRKKKRLEELQRSVLFLTHENHQLREQNELLRQMLVGRLPQSTMGMTNSSANVGPKKNNNTMTNLGNAGPSMGRANSIGSSTVVSQQLPPQFNNLHSNVNNYQNNTIPNQRNYSQVLAVKNVNTTGRDTRLSNVTDSGGWIGIGKAPQSLHGLVGRAEGVSNSSHVFSNNHDRNEK